MKYCTGILLNSTTRLIATCLPISYPHSHRMVWVGRTLRGHLVLVPAPCYGQEPSTAPGIQLDIQQDLLCFVCISGQSAPSDLKYVLLYSSSSVVTGVHSSHCTPPIMLEQLCLSLELVSEPWPFLSPFSSRALSREMPPQLLPCSCGCSGAMTVHMMVPMTSEMGRAVGLLKAINVFSSDDYKTWLWSLPRFYLIWDSAKRYL